MQIHLHSFREHLLRQLIKFPNVFVSEIILILKYIENRNKKRIILIDEQ